MAEQNEQVQDSIEEKSNVSSIEKKRNEKTVTLDALRAEAGSYRQGFVKVFKRHEGAFVTDAEGTILRDASNRKVKVTKAWFAEQFGIAKQTFQGWVNEADKPAEVGTDSGLTSEDEDTSTTLESVVSPMHERLEKFMNKLAKSALEIHEQRGTALLTVCKRIAGESGLLTEELLNRVKALQAAQVEAEAASTEAVA